MIGRPSARTADELGPLLLGGNDILSVLADNELRIIQSVKAAYRLHGDMNTSLPHSNFLTLRDNSTDRFIALPAYLGGEIQCAGLKWISSFPGNIRAGIDRASAVLILNSIKTGRPKAIMEGSVISAKRTAASAAIAAELLMTEKRAVAGFIGCGVINFEIARFLRCTCPTIEKFLLFDLARNRADEFQRKCQNMFPDVAVEVATDMEAVLGGANLISFATTATVPYVSDLKSCRPGSVVLNISLRDLSAEAVLSSDNVVDDLDHVCRANTSVHLAERKVGNRDFVRCSIADLLRGDAVAKAQDHLVSIFSPFGLGVLDVALGELAYLEAVAQGRGSIFASFFP